MNHFDIAHIFTARAEGGFVNNPGDPGGPTKYGVSLRLLRSFGIDINHDGDIDQNDIRDLTPAQAEQLLHDHFWTPLHCDEMPLPLAVAVYDTAVNMGPGRATTFLQQTLNFFPGPSLAADGEIGPQTLGRLEQVAEPPGNLALLVSQYINRRERAYAALGARPQFAAFLGGWMRRIHELREYITTECMG